MRASGESVGTGEVEFKGKYHFAVLDCVEHQTDKGNFSFQVECEALAGECKGRQLKFQYMGGSKLFDFAAACGLTNGITSQPFTAVELADMRAKAKAKQPVPDCDFNPAEAVGRTFCAEVVQGKPKDNGKRWPEIGFWIRSPFDPEAADIPKDEAALGGAVPAGSSEIPD